MADIEFISRPYASPEDLSAARLKNMLKSGVSIYGLYFLCVEPGGKATLEIFEGAELVKDIYKNRRYRVVGVAEGKGAAFELFRRMAADYLAAGRDFDGFREYLQNIETGGDAYQKNTGDN